VRETAFIDDPDDPRIAAFRDIRERDLVGRGGGFIAEGEVVLRAAARSTLHRLDRLLVAEKRLAALADVIEALPDDVPVYTASQAVLDRIVGFPIHRGILGHGRRAADVAPEALLAQAPADAPVLALFGIGNHDNIGGIFRNAAAFGAAAVLMDAGCCDPLYRKAIRVSVGACLLVPFARFAPGEDPIDRLVAHGYAPIGLSPSGSTPLWRLEPPARAALLLGSEGPGLDPALLSRSRTVAIPMAHSFDSLNVATTSGIALHHLVFARKAPGHAR